MKLEEVINKTEEAFGYSTSIHDDWKPHQEACSIAIQALKKQIPKKPIERHPFKSFGRCPECAENISIHTDKNNCGKCGQAIDWSNNNEEI